MPNRCSIDTNALLDWLLKRDVAQFEKVLQLLEQNKNFHVADMVVAELAFVLEKSYKLPRKIVCINIRKVTEDERFNCSRALFAQALPLYIQHPALSFVDCCAVYYALLNDATPLYTFDRKLANQAHAATLIT